MTPATRPRVERIVALDHKSAIGTTLADFKAKSAKLVTYGTVVDEDADFLYVMNGHVTTDDQDPVHENEQSDFTAVIKSAVQGRRVDTRGRSRRVA